MFWFFGRKACRISVSQMGLKLSPPALDGEVLTPGAVLCLVAQSCLILCDPMDYGPPGSSVHGDSPGKNTGVGCHALLQGIFPTQGLNLGLLHRRQILYPLSHQDNQASPCSVLINLKLNSHVWLVTTVFVQA